MTNQFDDRPPIVPMEPGQLFVIDPWVERDGSQYSRSVAIAVTAGGINFVLAVATIAGDFLAENAVRSAVVFVVGWVLN